MLLLPSVEDYVDENNPVCAIDAYVNILDMSKLGFFTKKKNSSDGQPPYSPALMLKIYIYYMRWLPGHLTLNLRRNCRVSD